MSKVLLTADEIGRDDPLAAEELLPLVYEELRRLAAVALAKEKPGQTIQATALVHEVYVRLVGAGKVRPEWMSRNHFLGAAAEAMRRILIENARRKNADKRGGRLQRQSLNDVDAPAEAGVTPAEDLFALDEALTRFALEEPLKAELVKLRYFAGLSAEEAGAVLGISRATAARYWDYARSWLFCELRDDETEGPPPGKSSAK